jgi:pyruvate dehydrogenase E2 component (dihydrolipoamide acetyltransferase)
MSELLRLPRLSDSMEQGTILAWLKDDGDTVRAGEELVEIETDKATVVHPAEAGGRLEILAPAGVTLAVGEVIARLGDGDEDAGGGEPDLVEAGGAAAGSDSSSETVLGSSAVALGPASAAPTRGPGAGSAGIRATPLARRLAAEHQLALAGVTPTGPGGRITPADVRTALGLAPPEPVVAPAPVMAPAPPPPGAVSTAGPTGGDPARGPVKLVEPSRLQSVVARRMTEARATVPEFGVATEVTVDAALSLREQLRAGGLAVPSINDLIVKAAALALREHPRANASYREGRFALYGRVNIGIAVAAGDALVVPTIFDADTLSLAAIAAEARRLAAAVRDGTVTPAELSGATFTISNLGMYGMSAITPIINAPQAAILGVGEARPQLRRIDGEIVERRTMTLTLICDHRILYGADAARLLSDIRQRLEEPLRLSM